MVKIDRTFLVKVFYKCQWLGYSNHCTLFTVLLALTLKYPEESIYNQIQNINDNILGRPVNTGTSFNNVLKCFVHFGIHYKKAKSKNLTVIKNTYRDKKILLLYYHPEHVDIFDPETDQLLITPSIKYIGNHYEHVWVLTGIDYITPLINKKVYRE